MSVRIKTILYRIYNDYFMKNRYGVYDDLINKLLENGYQFIRISEYKKLYDSGKHVIIRHDIDSDVKIARKMFEIEKKYNVKSTFYFREKTLDDNLIKDIIDYGSEFGYHYEEIATYVKKNKIKNREKIVKDMPIIKRQFDSNLKSIEIRYNTTIKSVAAHGDFINRKYNITNNMIFDEKSHSNVIEAYDKRIEGKLDARISDDFGPRYWKPQVPEKIIGENNNILILVHTRYWNKSPIERFKEDACRLIEGIRNK